MGFSEKINTQLLNKTEILEMKISVSQTERYTIDWNKKKKKSGA